MRSRSLCIVGKLAIDVTQQRKSAESAVWNGALAFVMALNDTSRLLEASTLIDKRRHTRQ